MKRVIEGSSFNTVVKYFNSSVCLFGTTVSVVGCFNDGTGS